MIIKLTLTISLLFTTKMLATNTMATMQGGDNTLFNSYGYAMLTIKPVIFKSSNTDDKIKN